MDITGQRFGRWTVLSRAQGLSASGHLRFHCRCDCGTERVVLGYKIRRGNSASCGCARREMWSDRLRTHGLSKHRLFPAWNSMMDRCYKPQNQAFPNYGGRGIVVCDRWHDVTNFIADNDRLSLPGLSMDRKNNDGPYSPENLRWTDNKTQSLNRRSNVLLTYEGRTQSLFEWAREIGMKPRTLWARVRERGWDTERALTTPVKR